MWIKYYNIDLILPKKAMTYVVKLFLVKKKKLSWWLHIFFYERYFNCKKYKKPQKVVMRVVMSSNVIEVNKTVHIIFFKYYKRLKRKIKTPKSIKNKFNC